MSPFRRRRGPADAVQGAKSRGAGGGRGAGAAPGREGAEAQVRRVEHLNHTKTAAAAVTAAAVEQARRANDAITLLESKRVDRLCAHDRELCQLAPDLDGCGGAAGAAGDGDAAVRFGPVLAEPTLGELDATRGAQVMACDGGRRLAVETLLAERALQDRQNQRD